MKKLYKFLLNSLPRPLLIRLSYLFTKIAPVFYKGNKVECTVCGGTFSKFLSYGSNKAHRENVLCPKDLTLERHRLMWFYLQNHSDFFRAKNQEVLHIAPEQCFYDRFKALKNIHYLTGDLVSPLAELHFDLHAIPLEDNRFNVVFCNHVLEHVDDARKCLTEIFRVMKPGGWGILQVPQDFSREETLEDPSICSPEEREKYYWQKDHVRLFGRDYPNWLNNAGFNVEYFRVEDNFSDEQIARYSLQKQEILYVVRKT